MKHKILIWIFALCLLATAVNGDLNDSLAYYSFDTGDYSGNDIYDLTGNLKNLTNSGSTLGSVAGILNYSADFDGTNDKMLRDSTTHFNMGLNNFSIGGWFYVDSSDSREMLAGKGLGSGIARYNLEKIATNQFRFVVLDSSAGGKQIDSTTAINTGEWYFVVGTREGRDYKLYINGVLNNSDTDTNDRNVDNNHKFGIGASATDLLWFEGKIDEVFIYNRALSSTEISELYNSGNGLSYPFSSVVISQGIIILKNDSGNIKNSFNEFEEINLYYNYTLSNDSIITDDNADCSFYSDNVHKGNLSFNSLTNLWFIDIGNYDIAGNYSLNVSCVHNDGNFSINTNKILTISNVNPIISLTKIENPNNQLFNYVNNSFYEFMFGSWSFLFSINESTLDSVNITLYQTNGSILNNYAINSSILGINYSSNLFEDFDFQPYRFQIIVNDSFSGSTEQNFYFSFNDSINPVCLFEDEYKLLNGTTNLWFMVQCSDEHFYSLNVTCPNNNYTFYVDGLNVPTYLFDQQINSVVWDSCYVRYCDGHTSNKINKFWNVMTASSKIELLVKDDLIATIWTDEIDIKTDYKIKMDRVTYSFNLTESKSNKFKFYVETSKNTNYIPSEKYKGWLVIDNNYWLDFNSNLLDDANDVKVKKLSDGLYEIEIVIKSKDKDNKLIEFESIGELNCVEDTFIITDLDIQDKAPKEFSSVTQALYWFFIMGIWILAVIGTIVLRGNNGDTIQLLNICQTFLGIFLGLAFMDFYFVVGFMIVLFAVGLGLGKLIEAT